QGSRRSLVRSTLVVAQFAIAIVLMIGTLVVYRQLSFVQNQKLGLDKEHVLILPAIREIATDFTPFREQLLRNPDIVNVSQSNPVPSRRLTLTAEASTQHGTDNTISTASLLGAWIDEHFFPTYGVEFAAGRNFSDEFASDTDTGFILNETAAAQLGWASPGEAVDQPLRFGGWQGSVIGVVKDFHFESLHQQIAPMIFYMEPLNYRQVSVKIRVGSDLSGLIDFLETQWQRYDPNYPLSYSFLDERFGAVYEAERKLGQIFGFFALLAVFITCLGLFGMAAFTAEQRTKEIGVRKVLGASVSDIVLLLSREFSVLVLLAFTVAAPLAYFSMEQWLEKFAYHTALSWWVFALVGLTALVIALLTVSYQSIKAALTNPVKVLRYE
ncbi:MAG: ABC transporter permease, partial [Rhodothermales bacterium]